MRNSPYINPTVKTFESDKSDQNSPYSKLTAKNSGGGAAPSNEALPGGGTAKIYNYILQENGFYLLQEDGNKIII